MKRFYSITILIFLTLVVVSCGKKNSAEPRDKKEGYFIKTIERTLPLNGEIRRTSFRYDDENRIKNLEFTVNTVKYQTVFTYNESDLITRIDQNLFYDGTDRAYGSIMEFKYTATKLNEYIEDGTSFPVTYSVTNNSYTCNGKIFHWDANNNLKRITIGERKKLDINYLSYSGIFKIQPVQMALAIFNENVGRTVSLSYTAAMDNYVFSKNVISNLNDNELRMNYFTSLRDDNENIIQTDVKNAAGDLIRRYVYTYELRDEE